MAKKLVLLGKLCLVKHSKNDKNNDFNQSLNFHRGRYRIDHHLVCFTEGDIKS